MEFVHICTRYFMVYIIASTILGYLSLRSMPEHWIPDYVEENKDRIDLGTGKPVDVHRIVEGNRRMGCNHMGEDKMLLCFVCVFGCEKWCTHHVICLLLWGKCGAFASSFFIYIRRLASHDPVSFHSDAIKSFICFVSLLLFFFIGIYCNPCRSIWKLELLVFLYQCLNESMLLFLPSFSPVCLLVCMLGHLSK